MSPYARLGVGLVTMRLQDIYLFLQVIQLNLLRASQGVMNKSTNIYDTL